MPDDGSNNSFDPDYNYPQVLPIVDTGGSYVPTVGGQWMNYTVNVSSSGSYTFEARVGSAIPGNTFRLEVDGVDVSGPIDIPYTGSETSYKFVSLNDIWLAAGPHVVTIAVEGTGTNKGSFDYFTFSPYTPSNECNPSLLELRNCRTTGGDWDYNMCSCGYGGVTY